MPVRRNCRTGRKRFLPKEKGDGVAVPCEGYAILWVVGWGFPQGTIELSSLLLGCMNTQNRPLCYSGKPGVFGVMLFYGPLDGAFLRRQQNRPLVPGRVWVCAILLVVGWGFRQGIGEPSPCPLI